MGVESLYATIFAQAIAPDREVLAACNNYGEVGIWNLQPMWADIENEAPDPKLVDRSRRKNPDHVMKVVSDSAVFSLLSTNHHLVAGTSGKIMGWTWDSVLKSYSNPDWNFDIPPEENNFEKTDANVLATAGQSSSMRLLAGCSDNNIHVYDLEYGKLIQTWKDHASYIHDISVNGNQCASASEDGSVKLWDLRSGKKLHTLEPYKDPRLSRENLGKWVGTVAISEDWMLCGGGPHLSLWHLRSLTMYKVLPPANTAWHVSRFFEDRLFAAGDDGIVYQMLLSGDVVTELPVSSRRIYSIVMQPEPKKTMCVAGSGNKIDVCTTNLSYKDFVLEFN